MAWDTYRQIPGWFNPSSSQAACNKVTVCVFDKVVSISAHKLLCYRSDRCQKTPFRFNSADLLGYPTRICSHRKLWITGPPLHVVTQLLFTCHFCFIQWLNPVKNHWLSQRLLPTFSVFDWLLVSANKTETFQGTVITRQLSCKRLIGKHP